MAFSVRGLISVQRVMEITLDQSLVISCCSVGRSVTVILSSTLGGAFHHCFKIFRHRGTSCFYCYYFYCYYYL